MVLAFLLFGVTQTPDGPFRRPHPGILPIQFISLIPAHYEQFINCHTQGSGQDAPLCNLCTKIAEGRKKPQLDGPER